MHPAVRHSFEVQVMTIRVLQPGCRETETLHWFRVLRDDGRLIQQGEDRLLCDAEKLRVKSDCGWGESL